MIKNIVLILIFLTNAIYSVALFDENSVEWVGTNALVDGSFAEAFEQLIMDSLHTDIAYHSFKLGRAYEGMGKYSKAIIEFKKSAELDINLYPFAYEQIAEVAVKLERYEGAFQALRAAIDQTSILPYRYKLYQKMYKIVTDHEDIFGRIAWLEDIVLDVETVELEKKVNAILEIVKDKKYSELDTFFLTKINTWDKSDNLCEISEKGQYGKSALKLFSTKTLYLFSRVSANCGEYNRASDWLHESLGRDDFSEAVSQKEYMKFRAELNYNLKNYGNSLKWAKKYYKKYGETSAIVMLIARSYRKLGKLSSSNAWYEKHIKLFPYHKKTHDILWLRAWDMEDDSKWSEARKYYKILYEKHKNRSKADDANFRYALSYFRENKFDNAIESFDRMMKKFSQSVLISGAEYWKARSLFGRKDTAEALELCRDIIKNYPADYYAYRSKAFLEKNGDSSAIFCTDILSTDSATVYWLDSISNNSAKSFTDADTARFTLGCRIAVTGLVDDAELILEPFEISFTKNLFVQYELSRLYKLCKNANKSFRVIKKLTWRIPISARKCMPKAIYSLLYPSSFSREIIKGAENNEIEPELISSIIRQESMFNPKIMSPVGAVGLMQIMPYTGKEIATDLKDTIFTPAQLIDPKVNIRYGSFYVSKLLKNVNGDKVQAIAGYNGGPNNVKRWKSYHPNEEFDLFVEDIGYSETRKYTKKVLGNYWTYKNIGVFK